MSLPVRLYSRLSSYQTLAVIAAVSSVFTACMNLDPKQVATASAGEYNFLLPRGFPAPAVRDENPVTAEKVELGRHLFYEKRLSGDKSMSCASCHHQSRSFADSPHINDGSLKEWHGLSGNNRQTKGITGEIHPRNAMALVNVGYFSTFTWANPLLKNLADQATVPLIGDTPVELGLAAALQSRRRELSLDSVYQNLFRLAFPEQGDPFSRERFMANVVSALEAFQMTLISGNSAYDRSELSVAAKRGENFFFSEEGECFHCHGGFNFSNSVNFRGKVNVDISFVNTGLYNIGSGHVYPDDNRGAFELTFRDSDMGRFRPPSLRNIELTAPYMHDGSVDSLEDVIDHYAAGGRNCTDKECTDRNDDNPRVDALIVAFDADRVTATGHTVRSDLVAFLRSLTDCEFVTEDKFANPWPPGHDNNLSAERDFLEEGHPCRKD